MCFWGLHAVVQLATKELKAVEYILEKRIEVLDIDETPAYGLETKVQLGINGVVECI